MDNTKEEFVIISGPSETDLTTAYFRRNWAFPDWTVTFKTKVKISPFSLKGSARTINATVMSLEHVKNDNGTSDKWEFKAFVSHMFGKQKITGIYACSRGKGFITIEYT